MKTTLAIVQMGMSDALEDNVAKAIAIIRDAAARGATVALLPEFFEGYYWPQAQREDSSRAPIRSKAIRSFRASRRWRGSCTSCCRSRSSSWPGTRTTTAS